MSAITWTDFDTASSPAESGLLAVDAHWSGFGGAHGGLLVAAAARQMARHAGGRPLRSIHADFLGGVQPGELQMDAAASRAGRAVTFASAAGHQDGKPRINATAVFGDPSPGARPELEFADPFATTAPAVPDPDDCPQWRINGPALKTIIFKPASENVPILGDKPEFHVWLGIAGDDANPPDPYRLITLADAPAPGLFGLVDQPIPIPTVEFTVQLTPAASAPVGRWVLARMRTIVSEDGFSVDDCELWDEQRRLLVTSRQTRLVLG
jgi:hypothetical protein